MTLEDTVVDIAGALLTAEDQDLNLIEGKLRIWVHSKDPFLLQEKILESKTIPRQKVTVLSDDLDEWIYREQAILGQDQAHLLIMLSPGYWKLAQVMGRALTAVGQCLHCGLSHCYLVPLTAPQGSAENESALDLSTWGKTARKSLGQCQSSHSDGSGLRSWAAALLAF